MRISSQRYQEPQDQPKPQEHHSESASSLRYSAQPQPRHNPTPAYPTSASQTPQRNRTHGRKIKPPKITKTNWASALSRNFGVASGHSSLRTRPIEQPLIEYPRQTPPQTKQELSVNPFSDTSQIYTPTMPLPIGGTGSPKGLAPTKASFWRAFLGLPKVIAPAKIFQAHQAHQVTQTAQRTPTKSQAQVLKSEPALRRSRGPKSFHAFHVPLHLDQKKPEDLGQQINDGIDSLYSELTRDYSHPELSKAYNKEVDEGFWEILANFSLWLLHSLRLEGLLFVLHLCIFSLLLQHYLPPLLNRYYFNQEANILLLPREDPLDQLLNEDILLTGLPEDPLSDELGGLSQLDNQTNQTAMGGGGLQPAIALASAPSLPGSSLPQKGAGKALSAKQLKAILYPAYQSHEYTVQSGENISLLAQRYRVKMSTLISVNHIERAKSLKAGQKIQIPNMDGLLHKVQPKDTLSSITAGYDTSIGALIDANQLQSETLVAGSQIFIPGASLSSYELRKVFGSLYIYPYVGRLSSGFGYRKDPIHRSLREFHNGVDIVGPRGASIKASSDGTVISLGYHNIYGNYIILQHAKGIKTLYGHMSKLLVQKGQKVIQGETIGRIGSTGRSTGPHVHFTIFVGGKAVNPLDYLSGP